jgi:hypothetical protein
MPGVAVVFRVVTTPQPPVDNTVAKVFGRNGAQHPPLVPTMTASSVSNAHWGIAEPCDWAGRLRCSATALEATMRKSILAAASVLALGIGGVAVGHATPGPLPSSAGIIPSAGKIARWEQGYGVPATPAQMARVGKELAFYRHLASGQQRAEIGASVQYAETGTLRELQFPGG